MLRCFIAIEFPEEIRRSLLDAQKELKRCGADIRWAKPESIHLTLKFLGDTGEDRIEEISERITDVCSQFNIFNVEVNGFGIFPGRGSPRILWAGIDGGEAIISLQKSIEESMSGLGFKTEKREYSPHLTIGRFRSSKFKETLLREVAAKQDMSLGSFKAGSVILYKSDLKPPGAVYTKIYEALLRVS
jgi:2'-5' RNA ligase